MKADSLGNCIHVLTAKGYDLTDAVSEDGWQAIINLVKGI